MKLAETKRGSLAMKDNEIAELVNELTAIANKYKDCQCMREKIRQAVIKRIKK